MTGDNEMKSYGRYGRYGKGYGGYRANYPGYDQSAGDEIDLGHLWDILVDNRWWLLGFVAAALVLGALYLYQATSIYQANALLQVEKDKKTLPGFSEMSDMFVQDNEAQTEIELIRSRMVLGQVVNKLNLDISVRPERDFPATLFSDNKVPGFGEKPGFGSWRSGENRLAIAELDMPPRMRGKPYLLTATEEGGFRLRTEQGRELLTGRPGQMVSGGGVTLKVDTLAVEPGRAFLVTQRPMLEVTQGLNRRLSVSEKGKDTGILAMSLTHPSPPRASAILSAIAEAYRQQNLERRSAEAKQSIEFLEKQIPKVKEDLTEAEEKLNQYRSKSDSVNLDMETESKLQRLVQLETKLNELAVKENQLQQRYTKQHPAYETLMEQRESLRAEKQKLEEQIEGLPKTQQEILRLRRDMEVNQEIYLQLRNKVQEMRVLEAGTVANVRIIDDALTTPEPVKPRKGMILALSLVLGGMAGVGFVLLRQFLNRSLQSPEELEELGLNVYASIPISQKQLELDRERQQSGSEEAKLLAVEAPSDLTIEALRALRTSLHFAMMDAYSNVLMLSGPTPGVGKSFITSNLGVILAQAGQRICLVDADLRRGHMHRHFAVKNSPGLSDYLGGKATRAEVMKKTVHDDLHFIPRGHVPPNPAELLMHKRMRELVDELANKYDMVIIDTPPILAVTDPAIVGQYAGACLTIVRYGVNHLKEVEIAHKRFEQNGLKIRGTILNGMRYSRANAYGYYPYRYRTDDGAVDG